MSGGRVEQIKTQTVLFDTVIRSESFAKGWRDVADGAPFDPEWVEPAGAGEDVWHYERGRACAVLARLHYGSVPPLYVSGWGVEFRICLRIRALCIKFFIARDVL